MTDVKAAIAEHAVPPMINLDLVTGLVVHHLDNSINLPMAVEPGKLEQFSASMRFETRNAEDIRCAFEALTDSAARVSAKEFIDARWGIFFTQSDGARIWTAHLENLGVHGMINGKPVVFERRTLLKWLRKRFDL